MTKHELSIREIDRCLGEGSRASIPSCWRWSAAVDDGAAVIARAIV